MPGSLTPNTIVVPTTLAELLSYLQPVGGGYSLISANLVGRLEATGIYDSLTLSSSISFPAGLMLTSGEGSPPRTNTERAYTGFVPTAPGNTDMFILAQRAFPSAGDTYDASILNLSFKISDPGIQSLRFDFAFASDEYPDFKDSTFVDIGAVWTGTGTGAINYALVNGDPLAPLSVINRNVSLGNFIDNTSNLLAIEYNGIIDRQSIFVPVDKSGVVTLNIGVADTGDTALDSALFLFGISASGAGIGGTFQQASVTPGQTVDAGQGQFLFEGSVASFKNVVLQNFDSKDQIVFKNATLDNSDVTLGISSLKVNLDTDGNSVGDTMFTFADPVANGTLVVAAAGADTSVTLVALPAASAGPDTIAGTAGLDYIAGAAGNDVLSGGGASDALDGGPGDDQLSGGDGADALRGGPGNDLLDGGSGVDIAFYTGAQSGYTIISTSIADKTSGRDGTDNLVAVDRLRFSDGTLALDIALPGQGASNAGSAYRLYEAAFNRAPDNPGLAFWIKAVDGGVTTVQAAQGFVSSQEFGAVYGANPGAQQLVTAFYTNILGRAPEQAGFDFWFNVLNNRPDQRAIVLEGIANSTENQQGLIGTIGQGIWLPGDLLA